MPFFTDKLKLLNITNKHFIKDKKETKLSNKVKLDLDGNRVEFENGKWTTTTTGLDQKLGEENSNVIRNLEETVDHLQKENNVLKLKVTILLDMLAEQEAKLDK